MIEFITIGKYLIIICDDQGVVQETKSRSRQLTLAGVVSILLVLAVGAGVYFAYPRGSSPGSPSLSSGSTGTAPIRVVAAENFWGSLASQLGGTRVNVTSIVSNPNTDPHEYESNPADAIALTDAQLIIVNGAGYDTWALDVISAENTPGQVVLNVQELIDQPIDANPHFWYSPYYVNDTVAAIYRDLVKIDAADASYFNERYANLNVSLWQSYMSQEVYIRSHYSGVPVASTENIFAYMANATGLNVVSPPAFMNAVAEGNDPPASSVAQFETLLQGGNSSVRLLVYNEQTVTPLTQNIKAEAAQYQIPTIGVTETIQPSNATFEAWMQGELYSLTNALNAQALGNS
jgi:zinc/manganese transport system substrate-binding protein